jgi:hypothetical protein
MRLAAVLAFAFGVAGCHGAELPTRNVFEGKPQGRTICLNASLAEHAKGITPKPGVLTVVVASSSIYGDAVCYPDGCHGMPVGVVEFGADLRRRFKKFVVVFDLIPLPTAANETSKT